MTTIACECASPAECLEALGGEQGLTADELEVARLRNENIELRQRLITAETAAAVAQRELAELKAGMLRVIEDVRGRRS